MFAWKQYERKLGFKIWEKYSVRLIWQKKSLDSWNERVFLINSRASSSSVLKIKRRQVSTQLVFKAKCTRWCESRVRGQRVSAADRAIEGAVPSESSGSFYFLLMRRLREPCEREGLGGWRKKSKEGRGGWEAQGSPRFWRFESCSCNSFAFCLFVYRVGMELRDLWMIIPA